MTGSPKSTVNRWVIDPCHPDLHDVSVSAENCERCGAILCAICMNDDHWTHEGHDLSDPRYWGV